MKLTKLNVAIFLFIASICIGIIGYLNLEGFSFIDALYMTIITISTVGFTEVQVLSASGRVFTSVYIVFNLTIYAYTVTVVTQYLIEGEVKNTFERIRKEKKIRKMNDHVIICGFGRNGSKAAEELLKNKIPVVIIEVDLNKSRKADPIFSDSVFISGDSTTDEMLTQAGIQKAKAIISSLPSDADNVFIALTARELNHKITIIARASDPQSETKLKRAGANHVVMPDFIGGLHMAGLIIREETSNLIYPSSGHITKGYRVEEIKFEKLGDHFAGKRISEINSILEGAMVVGYKRKGNQMIVNPADDIAIQSDDTILLIHGS